MKRGIETVISQFLLPLRHYRRITSWIGHNGVGKEKKVQKRRKQSEGSRKTELKLDIKG